MRTLSVLVVVALVLPACGGGGDGPLTSGGIGSTAASAAPSGMIVNGTVSDEALAAIVPEVGEVDEERLAALSAEVADLPEAEIEALIADLSLRADSGMAAASGIADASGGDAAFLAAATAAWAPAEELARTAVPPLSSGVRAAAVGSTDVAAGTGLFMGLLGLGMTSGAMVGGTNRMDPDQVETPDGVKDGVSMTASLSAVSLGLNYKGTEKDGMEIEFAAASELQVCPAENGLLDVTGRIDVTTRKGGKTQKATVDATMRVQVGDDAEAVSKEGETRIKWLANDGTTEQYIDVTSRSGSRNDVSVNWANWFTTTPEFARAAVVLGKLVGDLVLMFLFNAAEEGWKSGRCVQLNVTPSAGPTGMEPGSTASVQAQPRSKIDRAPTGGTVTAVLSAGANGVDPSSTPLPADAEFLYTAPGEKDQTGTVDFESKSKRGIGTASITFDTKAAHWFAWYSGEINISGDVPSLSTEFQLEGSFEGGTATFSFFPTDEGGGTFTIAGGGGGASLSGGGTYTIADNDDGTKVLTTSGEACVDVSGICRPVEHAISLERR